MTPARGGAAKRGLPNVRSRTRRNVLQTLRMREGVAMKRKRPVDQKRSGEATSRARRTLLRLYRSRDPVDWLRACDRACWELNGYGILGTGLTVNDPTPTVTRKQVPSTLTGSKL